jgi:type IV pilus assembly protein PilX
MIVQLHQKLSKFNYRLQQGSVLVISLILLLVMTLLGLSAMQNSVMEEMMAGNTRDKHLAFQSAEAALRDAENRILSYTSEPTPTTDGASEIWVQNSPDPVTTNATNWWCEVNCNESWWLNHAIPHSKSAKLGPISAPYTIVEDEEFLKDSFNMGQQHDEAGKVSYRITARGTGGTNNSLSLLRSSYTRRY